MTKKVICFGEALFDVFPTHTKIGGAPLNVALHLSSLGIDTQIISRIGSDTLGDEMLHYINQNGVSSISIQKDPTFKTGEVIVALDQKGSASYTINYPVAWDKIDCTEDDKNTVKNADAFVFGSLACRDSKTHNTLLKLISYSKYAVFDVNLRTPFYTQELLQQLILQANFIKFNDDELYEISGYMNSPFHSIEQNILFIAEQTNTKHICVTKGSHGAVLYMEGTFYYHSGYRVKVTDTVGAGDSFLAGLLSKLLTDINPQEAIDFACAIGALVATREGANPKFDKSEIETFQNPLQKSKINY